VNTIKFGTDGWRGVIADDFTFANVRKVACAIARYVVRAEKPNAGLIVAYDTRYGSERFARAAAEVVSMTGMPVWIAEKACPSPTLSLLVRQRRAAGGIMITASHNPYRWNGIKFKANYGSSALPSIVAQVEKELGIVLADISGKGIAAALLMANLQANLRSRYMVALEDPHQLLQSVNRLFFENTPEDSYATLFYADYDDANHCLRYANCGHNPPLLVRSNGEIEKLGATATVLGLFSNWNCKVEKVSLGPGDVLVIYTDGVTEAPNQAGEEFGESRLLKIVRSNSQVQVKEMLTAILAEVQQFSGASQADDLTLVIARAQ